MLLDTINSDPRLSGQIKFEETGIAAPVLATPSILASAALAKAAGAVVGAGAVTGAAYAAYRAVAR